MLNYYKTLYLLNLNLVQKLIIIFVYVLNNIFILHWKIYYFIFKSTWFLSIFIAVYYHLAVYTKKKKNNTTRLLY